jgi:hypothetical protein
VECFRVFCIEGQGFLNFLRHLEQILDQIEGVKLSHNPKSSYALQRRTLLDKFTNLLARMSHQIHLELPEFILKIDLPLL